jgi:hypothetical protein
VEEAGKEKRFEDTGMVRVTFEGTALPRWVLIHGLLVPIRLYSPKLMSCTRCLGDHHTAAHCNSGMKCLKCKGGHRTSACPESFDWCSHCRKNVAHEAPEDCEVYFQRSQQLVNKARGSSRRSYAEALTGLSTQNSFSALHNEGDDMQADVGSLGEGTSGAGIAKSTPRKRLRPRSPEGGPVGFSGRTHSGTKRTETKRTETKRTETKKTNRRKNTRENGTAATNSPCNLLKPNVAALRAALASFIDSLNLPPFVNNILNAIVTPLIDSLGPALSSLISRIFPSTPSSTEAQNIHNNDA